MSECFQCDKWRPGCVHPDDKRRAMILRSLDAYFTWQLSLGVTREARAMTRLEWEIESEHQMGVFTKCLAKGVDGKAGSAFIDEEFAKHYPTLSAFLTFPMDDEGKPRITSTVLLFVEQGQAKACLKERQEGLSLWVSDTSLLGCLRALEDALDEDPVPWRKSGPSGPTGRVHRG